MRNVDLKSTFLVSANLAILLHAPLLTNPLSFHMASFEPSLSKAELVMTGDAAVSPSRSALQLNRAATNSSGAALYHRAMQLWMLNGSTTHIADFTTLFYFNIISSTTSRGSSAGDGAISFLLLPPAAGSPNSHSKGHRGRPLGKSGSSAGQENRIVAVEFNLGLDAGSEHFGIDVSSTKSRTYVNVSGGFVNKGAAIVRVDYDSKAKNLSASLGLSGSLGSYQVSYVVDLSVVLPEKVHVGFTASAGTSGYVEIHQILSWSFSSSLQEKEEDLGDQDKETSVGISKLGLTGTIVCVVLAVVLVILLVVAVVIATVYALGRRTGSGGGRRRRRRRGRGHRHRRIGSGIESMMEADAPKKFSYSELSRATDDFTEESKIGVGGCGCVYRGRLTSTTDPDQTVDVAIKKWKADRLDSQAGRTELLKEMIVMSKTKHRNLVKLIGWCEEEGGDLLLVFEFIPNGTLAQHLFARDQAKREALGWAKRYEIARRLASGLQYLHEGLHGLYVVHRDIKASNVMLDYDYNPKLGDFGLARFTDHGNSMVSVSTVGGTCGYMDPELTMTDLMKYTKPSDVYSFGILALEIATGIRATTLAQAVWILHTDNAPLERVFVDMMDRSPKGEGYNMDEARRLIEVGFRCCDPRSASRPSMTQVMNALTNEAETCASSSPAASTSFQTASYQRIPTI